MYQPSVKSIYKTNHFANINHTYTNIRQIFKELVPSGLPLLKEAHKAKTFWYCRPFHLIYQYQVKEKYLKKKNGQTQYKIK